MLNKRKLMAALILAVAMVATACSSNATAAITTPVVTATANAIAMVTPTVCPTVNPPASPGSTQTATNWTIQFQGATKASMTAKDFAGLKNIKITATLNHMGTSTTADYTGVLFTDVLKFAGVNSYMSIKVVATDNYSYTFAAADINNDKTILATTENGALLSSDSGPVMVVAGAGTGNMWVKHVTTIIITK